MKNTPSPNELMAGILHFLAADGVEQIKEIHEYLKECEHDQSKRAHVWNPFAEILEGICKISRFTLSKDVAEIADELECLIELLSSRPDGYGKVNDDQILNDPEWRLVRRIAKEAIRLMGTDGEKKLTVYAILCHVAD